MVGFCSRTCSKLSMYTLAIVRVTLVPMAVPKTCKLFSVKYEIFNNIFKRFITFSFEISRSSEQKCFASFVIFHSLQKVSSSHFLYPKHTDQCVQSRWVLSMKQNYLENHFSTGHIRKQAACVRITCFTLSIT